VSRVGRPRTDRIAIVERVADVVLVNPDASLDECCAAVRARRCDVRRARNLARRLLGLPPGTPGRPKRVLNPESAIYGSGVETSRRDLYRGREVRS
jgi:hypothetical protein